MLRNAQVIVTADMEQVLLGSILGDGHLSPPPDGSRNWGLDIKHGLPQKDYCLHKAKLLGALVSKVDYPKQRIRMRTIRHPQLTYWASLVCPNGVKTVPEALLDAVQPHALAIWHMDDGSFSVRNLKSGKRSVTLRFASFGFTKDENRSLIAMLSVKFQIQAREWEVKTGKPGIMKDGTIIRATKPFYYGVIIARDSAERFLEITRPYAEISSMAYKWGLPPQTSA